MRCSTCEEYLVQADAWFCYWCGKMICADCAISLQLPMDTTGVVCVDCESDEDEIGSAEETRIEVMVDAAFDGHDLAEWVQTEDRNGWQARCRRCDMTVWVGVSGVQYSLLGEGCQ